MNAANVKPEDIGAFFFVSVTGVCSPSIEGRLINKMKLNPNMKRIPIFGLGCVAGAAGIARAADYVKAYPKQAALLLSVELCSLTVQPDDLSAANLISTGFLATVAPQWCIAGSECGERTGTRDPGHALDVLSRYRRCHGLGHHRERVSALFFRGKCQMSLWRIWAAMRMDFWPINGLKRSDIQNWVIHTGGPKVLDATETALGLKKGALDLSWKCLRKTGNLSSASVLFVLEETMKNQRPASGTYGILAAMGPGFCSELVLLKW